MSKNWILIICVTVSISIFISCQKQKPVPEITEEELTAAVPELAELHNAVYPLWHDAYPTKNYALIKELLPDLDSLTNILDTADLPGILQDKQGAWDEGKANLLQTLKDLHTAVTENSQDKMLLLTEQFHANYEKLVRTIRPLVKELDDFHKELYKLYHYYMPDYDLSNIRAAVTGMQGKIAALKSAQLSGRLTDRQEQFNEAVATLETAVNELAETAKQDNREAIAAAVEKVHTAYQTAEAIFD